MDPKDWLYWIFRILMFIAVIAFIFHFRGRFLQIGTSSYDIENYVYLERAINKLSYHDPETGRLYPGVIDVSGFNEANLADAYGRDTPFGFRLRLEDLDGNPLADDVIFNNDEYTFIEPLALISNKYINLQSKRLVTARTEDGKLISAKLRINFLFKTSR